MSKLMNKMMKSTKIKDSSVMTDSKLFDERDCIVTQIPAINIALSGEIDGGFHSGMTSIAGPSRHFKTSYGLVLVSTYMEKYEDSMMIYYDSEMGGGRDMVRSFGIDMNRVLHIPITSIEELMADLANKFDNKNEDGIKRGDKVIIFIDSVGNLASLKEAENAANDHIVADVGVRAKMLKSMYRIITPHLMLKNIPMVVIQHTYQTMEIYSKQVMSGGCLLAGTKIRMADGTLKEVQDIKVGELVQTLEGSKPVTHTWNPDTLLEGTPECFEITFDDGYKVVCSDEHKFLMNGEWVTAYDIAVTVDPDATESEIFVDNIKLDEGFIRSTNQVKNVRGAGYKPVYDISVQDAEHYILENGVVTHNTGGMLSSDTVWIVSRVQEKDGADVVGYNFNINIEKSRFVKEKSKIPVTVTWEGGINKYSGILDLAVESGDVIKPSNGWFQLVDPDTGEVIGNKVRRADTEIPAFLGVVLKRQSFKDYVKKTFKLAQGKMIAEPDEEDVV